jgi:undecaprenyl diphosphate synthase
MTGMSAPGFDPWLAQSAHEQSLLRQIDRAQLPRHVAVIMDGNGRWAKKRQLARVEGHKAGVDAVRDTVETAARLKLEVLTLYAFSVENWKRPMSEIRTLMSLIRRYLGEELDHLRVNNIRFNVIGRTGDLPLAVRAALQHAVRVTAGNTGMLFNIALSYGGRNEICDAAQELVNEAARTGKKLRVTPERLSAHLYTAGQPDPDLLIRTSGELRVSNFLLWQIAYAEIYVTDVLWPDFRRRHFLEALADFNRRERRLGKTSEQLQPAAEPLPLPVAVKAAGS